MSMLSAIPCIPAIKVHPGHLIGGSYLFHIICDWQMIPHIGGSSYLQSNVMTRYMIRLGQLGERPRTWPNQFNTQAPSLTLPGDQVFDLIGLIW